MTLTSGLGHSSRYSLNLLGWLNSTLLANQARLLAEHLNIGCQRWWRAAIDFVLFIEFELDTNLRCCDRISYQSVALPRSDFLVWKPTLKRKAEASWTVVRLISSPSVMEFNGQNKHSNSSVLR